MENRVNDRFLFESHERDSISPPSLLVADMIITLKESFGIERIEYVTLIDICNHCLNFIFNNNRQYLKADLIIEYVGSALPDALVDNKYNLIHKAVQLIHSDSDITTRANAFKDIRALFSLAIIEELEMTDYLESVTYVEDIKYYFIKTLSNQDVYGIKDYNSKVKFIDKELNVSINIESIDPDCENFKFKINSVMEDNVNIEGECGMIGLIIILLTNKYFVKVDDYSVVLEIILELMETMSVNELTEGV